MCNQHDKINLKNIFSIFQKSKYRRTDIAVEFQIEKAAPESWPRLTAEKVKLPWLKIDFDKFFLDDSDESNTEAEVCFYILLSLL